MFIQCEYMNFQTILFLILDFIILASIIGLAVFLVLFIKSRKQKKFKPINLNDLDAFKNKNLAMETSISLEQSKPVAPSTISPVTQYQQPTVPFDVPARRSEDNSSNRLFNCQMNDNMEQMNQQFVASQSNIFQNQPIPSGQPNTNFMNF